MPIQNIHAYLIYPGKGVANKQNIPGSDIARKGSLFDLLDSIFQSAGGGQDTDVIFRSDQAGRQQNDCRDIIVSYTLNPDLELGRSIAVKLQDVSDRRTGMGLLFLIVGNSGLDQRFVISRFPADKAILAQIGDGGLTVELLEQVFVKKQTAFKSLSLSHTDPQNGFWSGRATDRQINSVEAEISNYWLNHFLEAQLVVTPAAGTRRLAHYLADAVRKNPNPVVQSEIASAATLAKGAFNGRLISINQFCDHFGFSSAVRQAVEARADNPALLTENFHFDAVEFEKLTPYRSVSLTNGAILSAPVSEFFSIYQVDQLEGGESRYSTSGIVSNDKLGRRVQ